MEVKEQKDSPKLTSEIAKFYEGKSLFITGTAGFVGTILLETLLRCCPGVRHIYILLRPKRGVQPEDRKENIFKKPIFYKIREQYPDVLNKVIVVQGDISHDNLGMSSEDLSKVCRDVSIVFHCAANVSFLKPLSFMIQQNVIGTLNMIDLCRKLKKIEAFGYTSTAYSNCYLSEVEERIYKLPIKVDEIIEAYKTADEEKLMSFLRHTKFPNFYTFTKNIAETLIAEKASDIPSFIVRPSVIICCIRGHLPGYVEDGSGITTLAIGVGKGFLRTMRFDPDKKSNQIPVDVVVNAHIIAAYRQVVDNLPSPSVYNCTVPEQEAWTWSGFIDKLYEAVQKHPLPNSFQKPSFILSKNDISYKIHSIFDHYGPAFVIDTILRLSGKEPRLVKLYKYYQKTMDSLIYFTTREWIFKTENFDSLTDKLNATDKELYRIDLGEDYLMDNLTKNLVKGAPMFQKDYSTPDFHRRPKYVPLYLMSFIKWTMVGSLVSAFYMILF